MVNMFETLHNEHFSFLFRTEWEGQTLFLYQQDDTRSLIGIDFGANDIEAESDCTSQTDIYVCNGGYNSVSLYKSVSSQLDFDRAIEWLAVN